MHATRLANQEKLGGMKAEMKAGDFIKSNQTNTESANDKIRSHQFFKLIFAQTKKQSLQYYSMYLICPFLSYIIM